LHQILTQESTMDWTTPPDWLAILASGHGDGDCDDADRAGMGTAFGLDASMPPHWESSGTQAEPVELTVWERRLAGRSRP
jgi:hypothetical protein